MSGGGGGLVLTLLGNWFPFPQQGKHKAPAALPLHSLPLLSNIFLVILLKLHLNFIVQGAPIGAWTI
jgi:hypothetical protein